MFLVQRCSGCFKKKLLLHFFHEHRCGPVGPLLLLVGRCDTLPICLFLCDTHGTPGCRWVVSDIWLTVRLLPFHPSTTTQTEPLRSLVQKS